MAPQFSLVFLRNTVSQLQQVLRAFCLHNTALGYCQGMNFLASTALLFIGPEDTFWFLVAMTEHFHDKSYFDDNLAGAQADQEVLKELLEIKFPLISAHLSSLEIDLATITLNWFLALFFDAVPFNTLLRMWDCFLLEGPKVLFRFALALLGQHQDDILSRSDTIGIMKVIKAAVRLIYDVDGLFKLAFDELGKLPSWNVLRSKQLNYLHLLNEKLSKRQRLRSLHISNFDCRVCSFVLIREDLAFAGLISGFVIALHLRVDEW
ncbi:TBC domain protein [Dictyocaulus viviparus]|uniref:TBC domain protein n=1 Tax=Dictyocaulus viviparus TaxID=29172 RepID=A0A0D8XES5_DICVI|nr:TBC domain protein [Dictyocaulus viviparus]